MLSPGARRAPASSRAPALRLRAGSFGIRLTGTPPGLHLLDVRCDGFGCLRLRGGIGLRLLLCQLARMHHDKAQCLLRDPSRALLHLDPTAHPGAMPAARRLVLRPSRLLHYEREPGGLLAPGFEVLPDSTGARDEGDQPESMLETQPQGTAPLGLTIRHEPAYPLAAQRQTLLQRHRRLHTLTAVAVPHPEAHRDTSIAADPETEEHLCESITTVLALAIGRPGGSWGLRFVCVGSRQGNGGRVLMPPWCGNGIDLQGVERNGAIHLVEMGRTQRLEDVAHAVIMERGACESRLQQRQPPTLFQPLPHLVEGLMPIQNREAQGCAPATTCELVCWVGRAEAVDDGGDLQTPEASQDER
jgi:hypothetical protein